MSCANPLPFLCLAILGGALPLLAQVRQPGQQDPRLQLQQELQRDLAKQRLLRARRLQQYTFPYNTMSPELPFQMQFQRGIGTRALLPMAPGLPEFGTQVPGYGGYPGARQPAVPGLGPGMPPLRPEGKRTWPAWIPEGSKVEDLPAASARGLLTRIGDAVWYLEPGAQAYVPLAHHDRFRFLTKGARVQVRSGGTYHGLFHEGTRLRSRGASDLEILQVDEELLAVDCRALQRFWANVRLRPLHLRLPDGSELRCQGADVHLENLGDRIRLENRGKVEVELRGVFGVRKIPSLSRCDLWLAPATSSEPTRTAALEATPRLDAVTGEPGRRRQRVRRGGVQRLGAAQLRLRAGEVFEQAPLPAPRR